MADSLFKKPRLRSAEREGHERHPTWLELFYDLVFVVAISKLSTALGADTSWEGLGKFALLFVPIWWSWVGQTFYLTRFDTDDLRHRLITVVQMAFVAVLAVVVPDAFGAKADLFALFYGALRMMLVAEYLSAGRAVPEARGLTTRYAIGFGLAAAIWFASMAVERPTCHVLWVLAIVVDIGTPFTATAIHMRIPPHRSHLPERFGLFTIIVLGEAVAAVVHGMGHHELHIRGFRAGFLGLAIVFGLWWIYFDAVKGAQERRLDERREARAFQVWLYAHLPLAMAITATAVGIQEVVTAVEEQLAHAHHAWLLSLATGTVMLTYHAIFSSGPGREPGVRRADTVAHWLLTLATLATTALAGVLSPIAFLGAILAFVVGHVVVAERRRARLSRGSSDRP